MRIAVLWTGMSGYLNACLKELASRNGVQLLVYSQSSNSTAPYDARHFAWMRRVVWNTAADLQELDRALEEFDPELIVVAGWHVRAYRRALRLRRGHSLRVMAMDNPWRGTAKQYLGVLTASLYLKPATDKLWVPGERQAVFARKLGFREEDILRGPFSCDYEPFAERYKEREGAAKEPPRAFLFSGRLVKDKGIATLVKAYSLYRERQSEPWPLVVCGTGPLAGLVEGQLGIDAKGFVQPDEMPEVMARAGCFVLPSEFEPWALVLHEAAALGMILLASERVGASVHLLQPNYNGFLFSAGDAVSLAGLMTRVTALSRERKLSMSRGSFQLAQQYTPARWADTLIDEWSAWRNSTGARNEALTTLN